MKPIDNQNHYEILELPYEATWAEIQAHYALAKKTYTEDALGGYALFDDQERSKILDKIEEAYRILGDPQEKSKYDLGLPVAVAGQAKGPSPKQDQSLLPHSNSSHDLEGMMGKQIKFLREKKGITLEEIAETTRISINYLSSIEADRFEALPAEVYVYSYLQQMIKMIKGSDNAIVDQYMREYRKKQISSQR